MAVECGIDITLGLISGLLIGAFIVGMIWMGRSEFKKARKLNNWLRDQLGEKKYAEYLGREICPEEFDNE